MRYSELLSFGGTSLLLFVGLVLVNYSELSDHVLWSFGDRVFYCLSASKEAPGMRMYSQRYPTRQNLQGTYGGTNIEKSGVPCYFGRSSTPSLKDKEGCVVLLPNASLRIDPWWLRRLSGSEALAGWSSHLPGRLGLGSAEGAGMVASWKHPVHNPGYRWRVLRVVASILFHHHCSWKMDW